MERWRCKMMQISTRSDGSDAVLGKLHLSTCHSGPGASFEPATQPQMVSTPSSTKSSASMVASLLRQTTKSATRKKQRHSVSRSTSSCQWHWQLGPGALLDTFEASSYSSLFIFHSSEVDEVVHSKLARF